MKLQEDYQTPSTFTVLFWDFYALYHLWWTYGSGRQEYGAPLAPEIRAGGLGDKVDYAFEACATMMASALLTLMQANIEDEAQNGEDPLYAAPAKVVEWCLSNGLSDCVENGEFKAPTTAMLRKGNPSLSAMADFFLAPFWGDMDSGWRQTFGSEEEIGVSVGANGHVQTFAVAGPPWAHLCHLTARLAAAKRSRSIRRIVRAVDDLMHAEHNNGSIFNRNPVLRRGVRLSRSDLDLRRDASTTGDFLDHVSPFVKRLAKALEPRLASSVAESYRCLVEGRTLAPPTAARSRIPLTARLLRQSHGVAVLHRLPKGRPETPVRG